MQARIDVAASEHDLLTKQHETAKQRLADAQVSLKAAQETARNKEGQIMEMEGSVDKYRWVGVARELQGWPGQHWIGLSGQGRQGTVQMGDTTPVGSLSCHQQPPAVPRPAEQSGANGIGELLLAVSACLPPLPLLCRRQAEKARQAEATAAARVQQLEAALREVRGRVEQRRADISSQASQGAVVKALMEARQRGEIEGIYGRLGEEGRVIGRLGFGGSRQAEQGASCGKASAVRILFWHQGLPGAAACALPPANLSPEASSAQPTPLPALSRPCPGDLGAIAKEFDIAVSTSCPALDYIVVETTSAAQRCVELLRQRQLGVATFLILEKQQHLAGAAREKKQPPEGGRGGAGEELRRAARKWGFGRSLRFWPAAFLLCTICALDAAT